MADRYAMYKSNIDGKEATLASTQRKIFLVHNATNFGLETGIYDYCCKLGMKVFEPAQKTEFKDYYDMASFAVINYRRGGFIGETYQLNHTHVAYCSNDKVVPHVWVNNNAPVGINTFQVFTGISSTGEPTFVTSGDNTWQDYKTVGYQSPMSGASQITYFGCEPKSAPSTSGGSDGLISPIVGYIQD